MFCAAGGEIGGANGDRRAASGTDDANGRKIPATIGLPSGPIGQGRGERGDDMMRLRAVVLPAALLALFCVWIAPVRSDAAAPRRNPDLIRTCLITNDVDRLVAFYEPVLGIRAERTGSDYAEFHTGTGVLAVFSEKAQQQYIPGSAIGASNRGLVLEFRVIGVDGEYARLQKLVKTWVKPPTTQPWGTRSFCFRDPDGNLVDFYMPAQAH